MDACPEDLATSLRVKDLPTLERTAKEADLFLQARHRNLCDQPRRVFQNNALPKMDPVRLIEPEKKLNSTGDAKMGVADQRLCFKCKETGHIARYLHSCGSSSSAQPLRACEWHLWSCAEGVLASNDNRGRS
ncbi:hypothetical protein ElyMa_006515900 [Elysia marginata]|uniref:CCHC-type domain-containing protein n=1 Tax=Elysia marginata TaxID=1093978 RepID=A0AAV4I6V4_9GAST|nr:hypothetical protein ElyMa_006515900 [Elysia marginata]